MKPTGNLWWVTQSESTTLNESWPSPTCSPFNPVDHFRWKELFTRFTFVDSTVLINLGDLCKRALRLWKKFVRTRRRKTRTDGNAMTRARYCAQTLLCSWILQIDSILHSVSGLPSFRILFSQSISAPILTWKSWLAVTPLCPAGESCIVTRLLAE